MRVQDKKQEGRLGDGEGPRDATEVTATFTANVWEVLVKPGDEVEEGQNLVILEVAVPMLYRQLVLRSCMPLFGLQHASLRLQYASLRQQWQNGQQISQT